MTFNGRAGRGWFQFHKGAIRTLNPGETIKLGYKFQFHKGAIRTSGGDSVLQINPDFNSIKVRLELQFKYWPKVQKVYFNSIKVRLEQPKKTTRRNISIFQFHKGAIRTPEGARGARRWLVFQFHKGAIRTCSSLITPATFAISIP